MRMGTRVWSWLCVVGVIAGSARATAAEPFAGGLSWAHQLSGPGDEAGQVVSGKDGSFVSFVNFTGSIDVGAGPIQAPGGPTDRALALIRHDTQGRPTVIRVISGLYGFRHAVDAQGNIVILVTAIGVSPGSSLFDDGFQLVKLDATGRLLWLRPIPTTDIFVQGLAMDRDGNIGIAGYTVTSQGSPRLAFLKHNSEGTRLWRFVDANAVQSFSRTAIADSEGNFFVAGDAQGATASSEPYLVKLSPDGQPRWRRRLVGALGFAFGLATHGNRVVMVGTYAFTFTFAGQSHTSTGNLGINQDAFIAAWTLDGEERWAWNFGFDIESVAMDERDGVTVVGGYQAGSSDLGILGPLSGNPSSAANVYVAKFDRIQGQRRWVQSFPSGLDRSSPGLDEGSVAVSKDGRAAVLGLFHDTLQVGSRTWTASGVSDLFLFGFEP
ncbi:hypothetical protein [Myxococcus qinghaiensis]|uniref:hypothetical protein n=1 Tax=Myxococcus qinghaiensis TaxID=2906758 RepID=UPI0020A76BAA|nr:hypothetical protein [Myxococcus qinghaiensis]MCP3162615.1 hypothetical protein [Myxococcus qinghaiensis]